MTQEEKKLPEGLEEAAEKYNEMMSWAWEAPNYPHKAAFIAGAKWQKEQMGKQAREQLAKDEITLADLVAFDEGLSLGRRLERQDMMKNAVEGHYLYCLGFTPAIALYSTLDNVKDGGKVRVIVIKEDKL